jgi:hypothetical protein
MSLIFTTSAIATIVFLQIGRDWIDKGEVREVYIQNGYAMSIFWSACYTSVFVSILLVPLFWLASQMVRLRRQAKVSHFGASPYDQIYDLVSYKFLARIGAAVCSPIVTSCIAAVWGS